MNMSKKALKQWLDQQISLAISDMPGDYTIEGNLFYVFTLPEVGTKFKIQCHINPEDYKNKRLGEFREKMNKSKAWVNTPSMTSPKL